MFYFTFEDFFENMFSRKSYSKDLEDNLKSKLSKTTKTVKEYTEGNSKVIEESYEGEEFSFKTTSYIYNPEEYDLKRAQLQYELDLAVEKEDFEKAAKIKSQINQLTEAEKQKQNDKKNQQNNGN